MSAPRGVCRALTVPLCWARAARSPLRGTLRERQHGAVTVIQNGRHARSSLPGDRHSQR